MTKHDNEKSNNKKAAQKKTKFVKKQIWSLRQLKVLLHHFLNLISIIINKLCRCWNTSFIINFSSIISF